MSCRPSTPDRRRAAAFLLAATLLTAGCAHTATGRSSTTTIPLVAPSSLEIVALADRTAMTDEGRRLFYSARPEVLPKATFAQSCTIREEASVLGCFHQGPTDPTPRISLLQITDPHLSGMEEVTAAHEMLHDVWQHTSDAERRSLTTQLTAALAAVTDRRIIDKVATYRRQDPSVVPNELHSILGTEVAVLPAALERHYARWFTDRTAVTGLATTSQKVFADIDAQVKLLDAQLIDLRRQIDATRADLAARNTAIETRRLQIRALDASGDVAAHNAAVPGFNAQVNAYNAEVTRQQRLVDQHNAIVTRRNALASQYDEIEATIDTTGLAPAAGSA